MAEAEQIRFAHIAPVYGGGGLLPQSPAAAVATGRFNKVPVMHGITRDEYHLFHAVGATLLQQPPLTEATYAYQFDTDYFAGQELSPKQQRLSDQLIRYWTRFAHTGNPNGPGTWRNRLRPAETSAGRRQFRPGRRPGPRC